MHNKYSIYISTRFQHFFQWNEFYSKLSSVNYDISKAFWNNIFYLMLRLLVDLDFIIIHGRRFAALKGFWLHLTYNYHDTQIAHIHSSVSSAQIGILHDKRLIATRNKTWNFIGGLSFFLKRFYISHGKSNSLNVK